MKKNIALVMVAVAAMGLSACKEKVSQTEVVEKSTVNGTTVESKTTTETSVDDEGNRRIEAETKTTVDPEGMMNKETTEESVIRDEQ